MGKAICHPLDADCPGCGMPVRQDQVAEITRCLNDGEVCPRCLRSKAEVARDGKVRA